MLADKIRTLRKKNSLTQVDLARELDTSQQIISLWEMGRVSPDKEALVAIAKLFNVSVDYLLGNTSETKETKEEIEERTLLEDIFKDDKEMLADLKGIKVRMNGEIHKGDDIYYLSADNRQVLKSIIKRYIEDMKSTSKKAVHLIKIHK